MNIEINKRQLAISNLEKVYWPQGNLTKAHLINYYLEISAYLLPHLKDRPMVLKRYPDGIYGKNFYQKQVPEFTPPWIETLEVTTENGQGSRTMLMVNNLETLIWILNLGCIELHPWLSQKDNLNQPDLVVFDLDPQPPAQFKDALVMALKIKEILDVINIQVFPKTSGSNGLHLYLAIEPRYDFSIVRNTLKKLFQQIVQLYPNEASVEISKQKRQGKIYLDYLQNGYGKTMASVYSLRPLDGAPVSMPLSWEEVKAGAIRRDEFTIYNSLVRLNEMGDFYLPLLEKPQNFEILVKTFLN